MKTLISAFILFSTATLYGQTLNNIESVEYDPVNSRFLVSNGTSIIEVDGDGNPVDYFGNATADFGMEVIGDVLYTIDNGNVKAFSLITGELLSTLIISESGFLNGMASDGVGRIWVTDFSEKTIYEITFDDEFNGTEVMVVDNTLVTPNGITYDGANNRLVYVTWTNSATIRAVDLSDYSIETLATTTVTNIDGIDHDGNGNFYIASWSPSQIRHYWNDFTEWEVITTPALSNPADICYSTETDTLAIPNTATQEVFFIGFSANQIADQHVQGELTATPNPSIANPSLYFTLEQAQECEINVYASNGQLAGSVYKGILPAGRNRVLTDGTQFAPGTYTAVVTGE
ncbi:MAG: hypothetical protein RL220_1655, partial [Bacteroidota bacterium]